MKSITFRVYGAPKGKARPRFSNGHAYTPKETKDYERRVKEAYIEAHGECIPEDIPLAVDVFALFAIPHSWSKKKQKAVAGKQALCKPDGDNILKIVLDALNGVAYKDDKQVSAMSVQKFWSTGTTLETAGCIEVTISDLSE